MDHGVFRSPELMLVTDGDARVPELSVLKGVTMHAVQVGVDNIEKLAELASASGGIARHVAFGNV